MLESYCAVKSTSKHSLHSYRTDSTSSPLPSYSKHLYECALCLVQQDSFFSSSVHERKAVSQVEPACVSSLALQELQEQSGTRCSKARLLANPIAGAWIDLKPLAATASFREAAQDTPPVNGKERVRLRERCTCLDLAGMCHAKGDKQLNCFRPKPPKHNTLHLLQQVIHQAQEDAV